MQSISARPDHGEDALRIEAELRRQPVHPGYYWDQGTRRWELRGEFEDVPKRFLALAPLRDRRRPTFANELGDLDDRATALGFEDDGAFLAWMQARPDHSKRPAVRSALGYSAGDVHHAARLLKQPARVAEERLSRALVAHDAGCYCSDMTAAQRMKAYRARRAAQGLCSVCAQVPARAGKATCEACNDGAKARVAAGRARKVSLTLSDRENAAESEII